MKIEVDLGAIYNNAVQIIKTSGCQLCAVVKANAYSHGSVAVARELKDLVRCFAVAYYCEAKTLVDSGIKNDIIILGKDNKENEKNIIPTVVSLEDFASKKSSRYNLAVNTGMNRFGIEVDKLKEINVNNNLFSVFSHIYSKKSVYKQTMNYDNACEIITTSTPNYIKHLYASNFVSAKKKYDMVRAGIGLYGYGVKGAKRALSVYAEIVCIYDLKKGDSVGYGNFVQTKDLRVATVNIGYKDGFLRINHGSRYVMINNKKCEVVGQVCMDCCMVDVTDVKVKVGDRVGILCDELDAEEIASERGTIAYEILTCFNSREDIKYIY